MPEDEGGTGPIILHIERLPLLVRLRPSYLRWSVLWLMQWWLYEAKRHGKSRRRVKR